MTKNRFALKFLFLTTLSLTGWVGCSSIEKASIPATANPAEEAARLESDIQQGYDQHFDVLAAKDFESSRKHLKEAKNDLGTKVKQEKILDELRYGRAYFERARSTADARRGAVDGLLTARHAAIEAGAKKFPQRENELAELDSELREDASNFEKKLEPKKYAELQAGYLALELAAIQSTELDGARARITGAIDKGAKSKTPRSLRQAQTSLANAENTIAAHRDNSSEYRDSVNRAKTDAQVLSDVLAATKDAKGDIDEDAAIKIVMGRRQIAELKTQLGEAQDNSDQLDAVVAERDRALNRGERALASASATIRLQESIESARGQFSADEAEAFQQGDKLLIRLKTIGFASGKGELPSTSYPMVNKVKAIAQELEATQIVVSGHTDSVGGEALNQTLSQARAQAVADYLKGQDLGNVQIQAVGFGYKKPIATNKTKEGRAQNRRVDVIITPSFGEPVRSPASLQ